MARLATSFVLGFHGCDREVGERALRGEIDLIQSDKEHDRLGPGLHFRENDPRRARDWAEDKAGRGHYREPFVVGAVIDLGNCLDLLVRDDLELLKLAYESLAASVAAAGAAMPENGDLKHDPHRDKLLRKLDCAVIRRLHGIIEGGHGSGDPDADGLPAPFDTVRGLFTEGAPV